MVAGVVTAAHFIFTIPNMVRWLFDLSVMEMSGTIPAKGVNVALILTLIQPPDGTTCKELLEGQTAVPKLI